jgi:integral membrane protein (TIGR01906 family)
MKRILTITAGISLAFFILTSSVMLTLSIKDTYQLSQAEIVQREYQLDDTTIKENYNGLIDYMFKGPDAKLSFQKLPMSPEGEIHFKEVKEIFQFFFKGMVISGLISLFLGAWLIRNKDLGFLNLGSLLVFLVPAILSIPVLINFNWTFTKFHELAFSNDYWIFDPRLDPIIDYLPESLFLKNTLIILAIIVVWILLLQLLRKLLKNKIQLAS